MRTKKTLEKRFSEDKINREKLMEWCSREASSDAGFRRLYAAMLTKLDAVTAENGWVINGKWREIAARVLGPDWHILAR